jgi:superfamily I DNA/RNA helicase
MLQTLIKNVVDANLIFRKTHKSRFENEHLQKIIPYVKNIKTMKKDQLLGLIQNLPSYQSGDFVINGKQIIPDKEQEDVIRAPQGCNMRVLAGVGTGKTTTICCRIKYLIDNGVHPTNVLMLTFNVEACSNMGQKLDALFGFSINVEVKTIDSFCRKLMYCYDDVLMNENGIGIVSVSEYATRAKKIMDQSGQIIARQYKYVFFDEFQDISSTQFNIIKKFADLGSWVCCIGDDSQNIYQFRGSDNRYIINLNQMIPDVESFKIQTNYRSNRNIIEIANHCIKKNEERIDKNMIAFTDSQGITDLMICRYATFECEHIILRIKEYIEHGVRYDQIAILGRSSRRLKEIETQFEKEKIAIRLVVR